MDSDPSNQNDLTRVGSSEKIVFASATKDHPERRHDQVAPEIFCYQDESVYTEFPTSYSDRSEKDNHSLGPHTCNTKIGPELTDREQSSTMPRSQDLPIIPVGHQIGSIAVSDRAIAHIGDQYIDYSPTNNNSVTYISHDSLRVGVIAGTTAVMMSEVLSLAKNLLTDRYTQRRYSHERPLEEPSDLKAYLARDIVAATPIPTSWIAEFRKAVLSGHEIEVLDPELIDGPLRQIVPVIIVNQSFVVSAWEEVSFEAMQDLIKVMGIQKRLADISKESISYRRRYGTDVILETNRCVCLMDVPLRFPGPDSCPVLMEYGSNPKVSALLLSDDYYRRPTHSVRTAIIIFKSEEAAEEAISKWMRYTDTWFRLPFDQRKYECKYVKPLEIIDRYGPRIHCESITLKKASGPSIYYLYKLAK